MTLRELFEKIKTYNEVAGIIRTDEIGIELALREKDCSVRLFVVKCKDYKIMKKAIKDELIRKTADEILDYEAYEFNKDFEIDDCVIEIRIVDMRF